MGKVQSNSTLRKIGDFLNPPFIKGGLYLVTIYQSLMIYISLVSFDLNAYFSTNLKQAEYIITGIVLTLFIIWITIVFFRTKKAWITLFKIYHICWILMGVYLIILDFFIHKNRDFSVFTIDAFMIILGVTWFLYAYYNKRVKRTFTKPGWI